MFGFLACSCGLLCLVGLSFGFGVLLSFACWWLACDVVIDLRAVLRVVFAVVALWSCFFDGFGFVLVVDF